VKVAQYPAAAGLGNEAKRHVRPAGTIETLGASAAAERDQNVFQAVWLSAIGYRPISHGFPILQKRDILVR